jgi:chromosome segregation ATPase
VQPNYLFGRAIINIALLLPIMALLKFDQANNAAKESDVSVQDLTRSLKLIKELRKKFATLEKKIKELAEIRMTQANQVTEWKMQADELEQQLQNRQEVITDLDTQLQDARDLEHTLQEHNQELETQVAELQKQLDIVENENTSAEMVHQDQMNELHHESNATSSGRSSVESAYHVTNAEQSDTDSELSALPEDPQLAPEALEYLQRQLNKHIKKMEEWGFSSSSSSLGDGPDMSTRTESSKAESRDEESAAVFAREDIGLDEGYIGVSVEEDGLQRRVEYLQDRVKGLEDSVEDLKDVVERLKNEVYT